MFPWYMMKQIFMAYPTVTWRRGEIEGGQGPTRCAVSENVRQYRPTLIIWAESDRLVPPSYAEDFRSRIRDSRVAVLKECGHMPMFEKRDEFAKLVTEFLTEEAQA